MKKKGNHKNRLLTFHTFVEIFILYIKETFELCFL